ncbi:unnamed protein product [Boreogadus saida]
MEASGLYESITEPSFLFLANVTHKVLELMEPPNRMLQAERMDLLTAVQLIKSASDCLRLLRSEEEFTKIWNETGTEMDARFSERNNKYLEALSVLDPSSQDFLNTEKVKPLLDLTQTEMDEAQFIVARQFVRNQDGETLTLGQLVSKYKDVFSAMPLVLMAFKHALTFGASTALCENSFSTLKNVFSEHRRSMLHRRKENLIRLAFENDLSKKFEDEWKDRLPRRFHNTPHRRLQLY